MLAPLLLHLALLLAWAISGARCLREECVDDGAPATGWLAPHRVFARDLERAGCATLSPVVAGVLALASFAIYVAFVLHAAPLVQHNAGSESAMAWWHWWFGVWPGLLILNGATALFTAVSLVIRLIQQRPRWVLFTLVALVLNLVTFCYLLRAAHDV